MSDALEAAAAIESALADVVSQLVKSGEALTGIETALADALHSLGQKQVLDFDPLVKALTTMRPVINVTVPEAPSPVVHVLPAARFTVTIPAGYGLPERVMTIVREPT